MPDSKTTSTAAAGVASGMTSAAQAGTSADSPPASGGSIAQGTPLAAGRTRLGAAASSGDASRTLSPLGRAAQQQHARRRQAAARQSEEARTEALWGEMQATLAEVELSAAGAKTFFGPAHAAALDELRGAQVALAQAWARGEDGGDAAAPSATDKKASAADGVAASSASDMSPGASLADADVRRGRRRAGSGGSGGDSDSDDAEADMDAARRRREANDRYFERVSRGVQDVVGRLEEVAAAMGKVERESREVWSESDTIESGTVDTASLNS